MMVQTSIGDLIIEKLTFNNTNNVFYDKQVTSNISINNNKTFSTYFYKHKEYLDVGKYGFSRNTNEKYVIDCPEYELFNYKYDEKIKRQIAEGLNTYSKKRIGIKDEIICDRSTQEGLLLSKLEKLDNGYYIIDSPKGLIEIDINLYKDITISFNNETIFNIEYGEIQYISNSLIDVIE